MKTKFERLTVLAVLLVASLLAKTTIADLVAYYPLDEGSGTTTMDASGNGHDGILHGPPTWINSKTGYGKALYYNGALTASGWVNCGTWDPSEQTGQITVALWVRWDGAVKGRYYGVVAKRDGWSPDGKQMYWYIEISGQNQQITFCRGGSYPPCGGIVLPKGEWQHIAATFDGTTLVFYVNGEETGRGDFSFGAKSDSTIVIGAATSDGLNGFNGALDDVCIFDNALSKDAIFQIYNSGAASLISEELVVLASDIRTAKDIMSDQNPQKAVAFLEKKTTEYEQWKGQFPSDIESHHRQLISNLYFLLAKAKEGAGARSKDVIAEYEKSVSTSLGGSSYVPALLFLFKNVSTDDYVDIIRKSVRTGNYIQNDLYSVARDFELSKNWTAFELFLDGIFTEVNQPILCAKTIAKGLNKDGTWPKMFLEYCRNKPELAKYIFSEHEKQAQEYIAQNKFLKADKIYRDLISQCASEHDMPVCELTICECLFNSGQYSKAISELSNFIKKYKVTNKILVKPAIILKGRAYIELGEINQASDTFRKLMLDYPETKQTPEPNFYIGYCNILQDKLEEAKETLSILVRNYPESPYANKAHLCLSKVERMRRQQEQHKNDHN